MYIEMWKSWIPEWQGRYQELKDILVELRQLYKSKHPIHHCINKRRMVRQARKTWSVTHVTEYELREMICLHECNEGYY